MMFCPNCGRGIEPGTLVCPNCGAPISPINQANQPPTPVNVYDPANTVQQNQYTGQFSQPYVMGPPTSGLGAPGGTAGKPPRRSPAAWWKSLSKTAKGWLVGAGAFIVLLIIAGIIVAANWANILRATDPTAYTKLALQNAQSTISDETDRTQRSLGFPDLSDSNEPKSYSLKINGLSGEADSGSFDLDDLKVAGTVVSDTSAGKGSLDLSFGYGDDTINGTFYVDSKGNSKGNWGTDEKISDNYEQSLWDFVESLHFAQTDSAQIPEHLEGADLTVMQSDVSPREFKNLLNAIVDTYSNQLAATSSSDAFDEDTLIAFGFDQKTWSGTFADMADALGIDSSDIFGDDSSTDDLIDSLKDSIDDIDYESAKLTVFVNDSNIAQGVQIDMTTSDDEQASIKFGMYGPKDRSINNLFLTVTTPESNQPILDITSVGNHVVDEPVFADKTVISIEGTDELTLTTDATADGKVFMSMETADDIVTIDGKLETDHDQMTITISRIDVSNDDSDYKITGDIQLSYGLGTVHDITRDAQPISEFSESDLTDLGTHFENIITDNPELMSFFEDTSYDDDYEYGNIDNYDNLSELYHSSDYQRGYREGYDLAYSDATSGKPNKFNEINDSLDYGNYSFGYLDGYISGYWDGEDGLPADDTPPYSNDTTDDTETQDNSYDSGYEAGYADGFNDGFNGYDMGTNYDHSADTRPGEYPLGYSGGYIEGFYAGQDGAFPLTSH